MPKHIPMALLTASAMLGCASTSNQPSSAFLNNPRIVERDLSGRSAPVAQAAPRRPVERALVAGPAAATPATVQPAAVQPAPAPAVAAVAPKRWEVRVPDVRLKTTFERWAAESTSSGRQSYQILWDAEKHVMIDATATYGGTILDAVEAALSTPSIRRSAYPLEACLYPNDPLPLIRITKRGVQTDDCPVTK